MPLTIDPISSDEITLAQCVEDIALAGFDPDCKGSLTNAAVALRRLTNNRGFLGDLLIERLKEGYRKEAGQSGYGPQAIVLSPLQGDVFLRANIWPSESDHCFQASGAKTFVYGVPHDHNFSFLTSGYFGPGYRSDYYEYDYEDVAGYVGEAPPLRFVERAALSEGKIMLYRAHHDIHSQLPPESLSVSLNVMHVNEGQNWFDQYGFDLKRGEVTRVLSPNSTEVFLRTAVACGSEEALDLAEHFGRSHPSDRMRLASFEARAKLLAGKGEKDALWREAELSGSVMLAKSAQAQRLRLVES